MRQLADEAHCIGKEERQVSNDNLSYSSIKGGKQLVFCEQVRLADKVHQG